MSDHGQEQAARATAGEPERYVRVAHDKAGGRWRHQTTVSVTWVGTLPPGELAAMLEKADQIGRVESHRRDLADAGEKRDAEKG